MLAKEAGAGRIMVRMRETEYRPIYLAAGVHRILSETDVFIGALATGIEHEAVHNSMVLGAGESVAIELSISPESRVVGTTVSEIAKDPFSPSCVLAGLFEPSGKVEAPARLIAAHPRDDGALGGEPRRAEPCRRILHWKKEDDGPDPARDPRYTLATSRRSVTPRPAEHERATSSCDSPAPRSKWSLRLAAARSR